MVASVTDVAVLGLLMVLRSSGTAVRAASIVVYVHVSHLDLARADTWCLPILAAAVAAVALMVASSAATEYHSLCCACAVI